MGKFKIIGLMVLFIFATSVMMSTAVAAQENKESRVKSNADLASERVLELQTKQAVHIEKAAAKNQNEKNLYRHKIADLNEKLTISASLDSSTLVCGKSADGSIKIKDLGKDHKLRDIRIKASDLAGLPGIDKGIVKITHFNDAGLPDAVWIQEIRNDNGYIYFEGVPFSEVIIGGFVGEYEKSGVVNYQTSQTFSLGSTFDAANVNYLKATVTPTYTETSPYDIPTNGLVGFWKFDENTGTNVSDSSGNGNHGTASGMTWTDGKYNGAGSFDGVDDYTSINNNGLDLSKSITICVDVMRNNTAGYHTIIAKGDSYYTGYKIRIAGDKIAFYTFTSTDYLASATSIINDGLWHNIICVYDKDAGSNNRKIYVDGLLDTQNTETGEMLTNTQNLLIGEWAGWMFDGEIDNVMLYNRALSESEIKQIYYDSLNNLKLKTNSNTGYSDEIDESGTVSIPYDLEDSDITSLTAYVPESVVIGGVTVWDYTKTVTPFEVSATVGYTEDTTLISETLTDDTYEIYIRYTPGNDSTTGTVVYTADSNPVLESTLLDYKLTTNDANAVLTYNSGTRKFTITSVFTEGVTYNYKITCTKTGTAIPSLPAMDGFGDSAIEVYEATGNESYLIGAVYDAVPRDSTSVISGFSSSLALMILGPMILVSVLIIGYLRRV
jgi:hypothetical protein